MHHVHKITVASALLIVIAGCSIGKFETSKMLPKLKMPTRQSDDTVLKNGPTKVITDASALALELPESDLQARSRFRQRFADLLKANRVGAADLLVARHPGDAYEILTNTIPDGSESQLALATSYDRYCQSPDQWLAVVNAHNNEYVQSYFAARSQWMGFVSVGKFAKTESIDLVAKADATGLSVLIVDAWYQTGIGAMIRQSNEESAIAFQQCATYASDKHAMQAATSLLMCSEAKRRSNDFSGAITAWQESIAMACHQLSNRHVSDPEYWDRAIYLQPVGTPWPLEVAAGFVSLGTSTPSILRTDLIQQLALVASSASTPISAACWAEAAIGSWQQARGETQKSLVRLKKSETQNPPSDAIDWLRIAQADLLVAMGQNGTATTILAPIVSREDGTAISHAATAKLGVMKLKTKPVQHGIRLLKHSVGDETSPQWPGKSGSRADYALGLLMVGDDAEGLRQLSLAQQQFESEGEVELLAKTLWNQWQYLKHTKASKTEISSIKSRLDIMQL